ncbi:DUF4288 domain-containing protein [bacterium]|nr:DUF4288 domain-containing protein [Planctomicrobium sp.]MDA7503997.1 DUF4288 domain-containing protein [bacterium]
MSNSIIESISRSEGIPFVVQFVSEVTVGTEGKGIIQMSSFFLTASSEDDARKQGMSMINTLSESYRNSQGEVVTIECKGVHSVEELDYVDDNGRIELGGVLFTGETSINDLTEGSNDRQDLPSLD